MSHVQNLQHAVMAAKAGNPSLARVHLHKAAEEAPDDPAVWLWMGWLSESPISMVQCLEAAIQDERHRNIAQAGLAFARALSAYQVASPQNQDGRQVASEPTVPARQSADPVELVEQLAANVAQAERDQANDSDNWPTPELTQSDTSSSWDPNGLVPPPLPPEARRPSQQAEPETQKPEPVVDTVAGEILGSQSVPPPLPPDHQFVPHAQSATPQPVSQSTSQSVATGQAPVWRAASSDWFTVDSGSDQRSSTIGRPAAQPAAAARSEQPQPTTYGSDDAWSQPAAPRTAFTVPPHSVPHTSAQEAGPSAAQQLDEELERRHVDVERETAAGNDHLESADDVAADSPAADFEPAPEMTQAPVVPSPAVPSEPWRPTVTDRAMPAYESPELATAPVYDSPALSAAGVHGAVNSGPTFEGEPLKPAAHPRTVLVVDDSPTVRKLVAMTLEKNGYRVVSAYDGVAAIREIAEHNPALILMDVNMPRMDGYQLCKLVRKHEATRHIPVLMLSGKDGVFDRLRGKMVGCSGYVPKPFVPEELVQAVGEHIGVAVR
jgi:twitching motility two-component system response regulator PilG